jgi:hypothetical protein
MNHASNRVFEHFRNKWLYYLSGLIVLYIILYEAGGITDFDIFWYASRDLLQGKDIYLIKYHHYYHYFYSVFFAFLLAPFTLLPLYLTKVIWLILNVFFVYRIWKVLVSWLPVSLLDSKRESWFILLSFVFILSFLRDNFHLGQLNIFILYLTIEGLYLLFTKRKIFGSFLIAFAIDIKLLPLLMIPYLLYRKEWKAALWISGFIIVLMFVPAVILGLDFNNSLLIERWHLLNPLNNQNVLDTAERSFHSLTTLLATLLVKDCNDPHALNLRRNIADISVSNLNLIINIVRGAFLLFSLYFLKTRPFRKQVGVIQRLYEISYICLIIPLLFPYQQNYAFIFIFPASTYLIFYMLLQYFGDDTGVNVRRFRFRKITMIASLSIVYFLTNSHFILGQFNDLYDHYKSLTYGVLILIVLLAVYKPAKLNDSLPPIT